VEEAVFRRCDDDTDCRASGWRCLVRHTAVQLRKNSSVSFAVRENLCFSRHPHRKKTAVFTFQPQWAFCITAMTVSI